MEDKKLYKVGEAANILGVTPQTLRNYHYRGILIPELILKTGHRFYTKEQLEEFIKKYQRVD